MGLRFKGKILIRKPEYDLIINKRYAWWSSIEARLGCQPKFRDGTIRKLANVIRSESRAILGLASIAGRGRNINA